jgi:apolipoprotein N-acyltransferase
MTGLAGWLWALGAGLAWGLCFGPRAWLVAPWVGLIPLVLLLRQRRPAVLGWVFGVSFWVTSIPWIVPTLQDHGQLPLWMAVLGLSALAAYLALFSALFAGLGAPLWRSGGAVALMGLPALWVVTEWLREVVFSGFPWNLAAYAWIEVAGALQLASWVGPYGVGFLLVLCNVALGLSLVERRWRLGVATVGICLVVLAAAARWGTPDDVSGGNRAAVVVRVLQPNIGILEEWDDAMVEEHYQRIFEFSRRACDRPGALLVWPESAAWPYAYSRDERLRRDLEELASQGCAILVNTSMAGSGGIYNSLLLVDEGGMLDRYDKRHLVPYGEYVPMASWLPFLDKIARNAGAFLPGAGPELLEWTGQSLAAAICFEVTFPAEVAGQVQQGGTILVTVTNDAWYGDSWAPWQHFRAARFRAAENRRYLLRAAITGVSAVVGPGGEVLQELGLGEAGILSAEVPGRLALSPFTRAPWLVPVLCIAVSAFAIFLGRRGSKR